MTPIQLKQIDHDVDEIVDALSTGHKALADRVFLAVVQARNLNRVEAEMLRGKVFKRHKNNFQRPI